MSDEWRQVKEIFNAALQHKPEERSEFLNEACSDDEDLRREVESLLSAYNEDSFLERPAVCQVVDVVLEENAQLSKGERLDHYEIISKVGAGGMGEVYLADDKKLDRRVAIKILNEKFSQSESNLRRFIREAKAASSLNHPNILVIYEIGEKDETHYIVSEYVEGKTLKEILKQKTL